MFRWTNNVHTIQGQFGCLSAESLKNGYGTLHAPIKKLGGSVNNLSRNIYFLQYHKSKGLTLNSAARRNSGRTWKGRMNIGGNIGMTCIRKHTLFCHKTFDIAQQPTSCSPQFQNRDCVGECECLWVHSHLINADPCNRLLIGSACSFVISSETESMSTSATMSTDLEKCSVLNV